MRRTLGLAVAILTLAASIFLGAGPAAATVIPGEDFCDTQYDPQAGDGLTIQGTSKADVLLGTDGPDIIHGNGGADLICGFGGDDVIYGGSGNDDLFGGEGDDLVYGGTGDDELVDNRGWNELYGEGNVDDVIGGGYLSGGSHDDFLSSSAAVVPLGVSDVGPTFTLDGGSGDDDIFGAEIGGERLLGGSGNDFLTGGAGDDELDCGSGFDEAAIFKSDRVARCEIENPIS